MLKAGSEDCVRGRLGSGTRGRIILDRKLRSREVRGSAGLRFLGLIEGEFRRAEKSIAAGAGGC